MTVISKNQESPENEDRLLTSDERSILSQVAMKDPPYSRRAQTLLAIDEGTTQAEAGRQAGLTFGQVRYWLGKFRKDRMSIFPDESLKQEQLEEADSPQSSAVQEDAPKTTKKPKKKPKKRSKKAKKSKKVKKTKQAKKAKKGKKSTKKTKKKQSRKAKGAKGRPSKKTNKNSKK